jgi:hypothetical protein
MEDKPEIDWTNNTCYVIINGGEPMHKNLMGMYIAETTANVAHTHGYKICSVCSVLIPKNRYGIMKDRYHLKSKTHIDAVNITKKRLRQF